ncbi:hypothetical protein AmDm5_2516 [Acetobacter malorum]|nr:hypothetical protein AmDm5_2516 [Acetobacter malorum]
MGNYTMVAQKNPGEMPLETLRTFRYVSAFVTRVRACGACPAVFCRSGNRGARFELSGVKKCPR